MFDLVPASLLSRCGENHRGWIERVGKLAEFDL